MKSVVGKACGRSQQVIIYTYNEAKASIWWEQIKAKLGSLQEPQGLPYRRRWNRFTD